MTSVEEIHKINIILQNKKIYSIKFIIPKDEEEYYTLYEINTENWYPCEFNNNLIKELNEFNKNSPIPIQNIIYKLFVLIKEKNEVLELIWKEI